MAKRVGVQIGDEWLVWSYDGETARVPARVGALVRGESVAYLLAGDEVKPGTLAVQWPRRYGYRWGDERTSTAILGALLARVLQGLPPGGAPGLVLAVPYWVQPQDPVLETAALEAGWGEVTLVTDLHALLYAAEVPGDSAMTLVPGSELVDVGVWERQAGAWRPVAFESCSRAEVRRRLAEWPGAVVVGGDLEWPVPGAVDLGCCGVAKAAEEWGEVPPVLPVPQLYLETEQEALPLPTAGDCWRALTAPGHAVSVRMTGAWGGEDERSMVLWERRVEPAPGPFLVHIAWRDRWRADVAVGGVCGRLQIRPM